MQATDRKFVQAKSKVSSIVKDLGLSGMYRWVVGFVVPYVLAECGAFISNDHYIPFETSGN